MVVLAAAWQGFAAGQYQQQSTAAITDRGATAGFGTQQAAVAGTSKRILSF